MQRNDLSAVTVRDRKGHTDHDSISRQEALRMVKINNPAQWWLPVDGGSYQLFIKFQFCKVGNALCNSVNALNTTKM